MVKRRGKDEGEGEEGEGGEWRGGREWNRKARGLGSWGGSCKKVNSLIQNVSFLCISKCYCIKLLAYST